MGISLEGIVKKALVAACSFSLLTAPLFYDGGEVEARSLAYKKPSQMLKLDQKKQTPKKPKVLILPPKIAKFEPESSLALDSQLENYLNGLYQEGILGQKDKVSLAVYDLKSNEALAVFEPKAEPARYMAASLIKLFVMLGAYDKMSQKGLCDTEAEKKIEKMIVYSNNPVTNELIDYAGGLEEVNKTIQEYGFKDTILEEKIPKKGKTYKNKTSTHDLTSFLVRVYHGKLVSPECSERMRGYLARNIYNKIETPELRQRKVKVADKTGSVRGMEGDAGIVYLKEQPYVLTILIENKEVPTGIEYWQWKAGTEAVIGGVSNGVYRYMKSNPKSKSKTLARGD